MSGSRDIPHAVQYFASPQEHTAVRDTSFPFQTISTHRRIYELLYLAIFWGHAVAQLVEALRYKPEGHGIDS
jgi:hypothetical protein